MKKIIFIYISIIVFLISLSPIVTGTGLSNLGEKKIDNYENLILEPEISSDDVATIDSPGNQTYEEGTTGNTFRWKITLANVDIDSSNYTVYKNSSVEIPETILDKKVSNLDINIDASSATTYNYTLNVTTPTNTTIDTVFTFIVPASKPKILTKSQDPVREHNASNAKIFWRIFDYSPNSYFVWRNGTVILNRTWASDTEDVNISVSNLDVGIYNFTILAVDDLGLNITDIIFLEIKEEDKPILTDSPPNEIILSEEDANYTLSWIISDLSGNVYEILLNGTQVTLGTWESNQPITYEIFNNTIATYNYTLNATDGLNNSVIDTVLVKVTDLIPPQIIAQPNPEIFILPFDTFELNWTAFDKRPNEYIIYQNGSDPRGPFVWSNNQSISFIIGNLEPGTHNFTISFSDTFGNLNSSTVFVIVGSIPSQILNLTIAQKVEVNDIETITIKWLQIDGTPISNGNISTSLLDSSDNLIKSTTYSTDNQGSVTISLNYENLKSGTYIWKITLSKFGFATKEIIKEVTVSKALLELEFFASPTLIQGELYQIIVKVFHLSQSSNLALNQLSKSAVELSGIEIMLIIHYVDILDHRMQLKLNSTTNSTGYALFEIDSSVTKNLKKITEIQTSINSESYDLSPNSNQTTSFPEVMTRGLFNRLAILYTTSAFLFLLIFVILIFVLGVILVPVLNYIEPYLSWLRYQRNLKNDINLLSDMLNIEAIIVRGFNGIPVYERIWGIKRTDSTLMAGMTTALTSFLNEVGSSENFAFETIERGDIFILTHKASRSFITILSTKKLGYQFMNNLQSAHASIDELFVFDQDHVVNTRENQQLMESVFTSNEVPINYVLEFVIDNDSLNKMREKSSISKSIYKEIENLILYFEKEDITILTSNIADELISNRSSRKFMIAYILAWEKGILKSKN